MTTVPLPDVPCVRIRVIWNQGSKGEGGNRLYLSYSGSAPTAGNCSTLASDVASAWGTNIAPLCPTDIALTEVDVLDIATNSGLSGQWTGSTSGTRSGGAMPFQVAGNVEFGISRRYRGGKPRIYLPAGTTGDTTNEATWSSTFVTAMQNGVSAWISALEALSIGSMGTLQHVNLSYYKGFQNFTTPSGRERAVPTYRTTALHDVVTGYFAKATMGSQRRRRTSTSP